METLRIYKSPYPKKRVGRPHDGGYVICDISGGYDCLISGGISNDISFEQAFLDIFKDTPCYAFDGTIPHLPAKDKRITFIRKNLAAEDSSDTTNLKSYMDPYKNIFMKMDIEGHEFRILPELVGKYMLKVKQLVLEVHTPGDIQLHPGYFKGLQDIKHDNMFLLLKEINKTHTLVHLHPNNGCKTHYVDGILVPNVFECTYLRNDFISERLKNKELSTESLPTEYDMRNIAHMPELTLSGFPWCNTL